MGSNPLKRIFKKILLKKKMKKNYPVKKSLNNSFLKKKLKSNNFALVLGSSIVISGVSLNQNFLTKNSANNNYFSNLYTLLKPHFPLNFYFFKKINGYNIFIKNNFKNINIFKIINKFLKKLWLNKFFFSNPQKIFVFLNIYI